MQPIRPFLAVAFAALTFAAPRAASAVGVANNDAATAVQEDVVFVVYDEASRREHMLYAARLAPPAPRVSLGLLTPSAAAIEPLPGVDLMAALHALVAPHEARALGRPPAPPAPWSSRGATLVGTATPLGKEAAAEKLFDAKWLGAAGEGSFLALLGVTAPVEDRVELVTPAVHLAFDADRPILVRREPPRATPPEPDVPSPRLPVVVESVQPSPKDAAPSEEAVAKVLRARTADLLACYERFLEQRPGEARKITVEAVIRPKGEPASARLAGERGGATEAELGTCVAGAVKARQFPRTDAGWRFSADIAFTPPRTPARRTHVVTLGPSRLAWEAPEAQRKLAHDFEVSPADLAQAFAPELRRAMGLPEGRRIWLTHWLDRDERRTAAEDVVFTQAPIPADGEPGTLGYVQGQALQRAGAGQKAAPRAATAKSGASRRWRMWPVAGSFGVAAVAILIGLFLSRDDRRGPRG
ncbi:hypothetical protein [Polyangium aurulentum]|uniref:hypothetical protein n=1 Tax=Polyangium aurulentum TaxID=2567896 RepID=UPI0010AE060E|nr:hypothetical protein [Polyangium aurulentum]UQA58753.1 hypothetical protein E8A73_047265 [Polyangium aurulentum]